MSELSKALTEEMERDLGVKMPPALGLGLKSDGIIKPVKPVPTHAARIDELISELQMTIRILEEAKKRL